MDFLQEAAVYDDISAMLTDKIKELHNHVQAAGKNA
jgi:hypothetical protein